MYCHKLLYVTVSSLTLFLCRTVSAIPSGTNSLTFYMEEGEDVEEEDEELTQQEPEEILVRRLTYTANLSCLV